MPYLDAGLPLLVVDEGVVLNLLDPLDLPVGREDLLQLVLGHRLLQVAHVQHFHLQTIIFSMVMKSAVKCRAFSFYPTENTLRIYEHASDALFIFAYLSSIRFPLP